MGRIRFLAAVSATLLVFTIPSQAQENSTEFNSLSLKSFTKLSLPSQDSQTENELSGSAKTKSGLSLFVTDGESDHYIYKLDIKNNSGESTLKPWLDLNSIPGFQEYVKNTKERTGKTLDLEGIAVCEKNNVQTIFLVNERARDIIKIEKIQDEFSFFEISSMLKDYISHFPEKLLSVTSIEGQTTGYNKDPYAYKLNYSAMALFGKVDPAKPQSMYDNAGFEGIAADCEREKLYVAKERQPRYIVKTDFNGNVDGILIVPTNSRHYTAVLSPMDGKSNFLIEPDISDLYFFEDNLFVLERNSGSIAQLQVDTGKLVARYDYSPWEFIYDELQPKTNMIMPFGMAETLVVSKKKEKLNFRIGFDNGNENRLNAKGFGIFGRQNQFKDNIQYLDQHATNALVITLAQP